MSKLERHYTTREVATLLGCHPETIRRWVRDGKIGYVRPCGGRIRIPESEVMRELLRNYCGRSRVANDAVGLR